MTKKQLKAIALFILLFAFVISSCAGPRPSMPLETHYKGTYSVGLKHFEFQSVQEPICEIIEGFKKCTVPGIYYDTAWHTNLVLFVDDFVYHDENIDMNIFIDVYDELSKPQSE